MSTLKESGMNYVKKRRPGERASQVKVSNSIEQSMTNTFIKQDSMMNVSAQALNSTDIMGIMRESYYREKQDQAQM